MRKKSIPEYNSYILTSLNTELFETQCHAISILLIEIAKSLIEPKIEKRIKKFEEVNFKHLYQTINDQFIYSDWL